MQLALTVLSIVAPVFILGAVGFAWVRLGFEYRVEFVTRLAMTLSVPCLIYVALMRAEVPPSDVAVLAIASAVAYGLLTAIFWVISSATLRPLSGDFACSRRSRSPPVVSASDAMLRTSA